MKPEPSLKEVYEKSQNEKKEQLLRAKYKYSRSIYEENSRKIASLEKERRRSLEWMEFFEGVDLEECFIDESGSLHFTAPALKRAPIVESGGRR